MSPPDNIPPCDLRAPGETGCRLTTRHVLAIALPITLSNATVPLIGFVDATVIGQLGETRLIAAVALAAQIFSFLYFIFNFLRMGTTGLTAQATGARDSSEIAANLARALLVACTIGVFLVVLQVPITEIGLWLMGASEHVSNDAREYIYCRIWAAPAALSNFALLGWFFGIGRARLAFVVQLILNGINILLSIIFVLAAGWGIAGVALASVFAEYIAVFLGLFIARRELHILGAHARGYAITQLSELRRLFAVSSDILIRTIGLQIAMSFFVAQSARTGDLALASNHVLLNIVLITVYMIDGFAFAVETLVGQSIGARDRTRFRDAIRLSAQGALVTSGVLSLFLWTSGPVLIDFMTTSVEVRSAAREYLIWAALVPVASVWCFMLDGIFIGATATSTMRNMMLISLVGYFLAWAILMPAFQNHGLWLSLHILFLLRAITLGWALPGLYSRFRSEEEHF
ncbi:MAG: MATE family efflux transporter [Hyphomicrobiaceae bacterium]